MKAREELRERVRFLGRYVVEECWVAFSRVVGDGRFAGLGLGLVGCLARFRTVLEGLGEEFGVSVEIGEEWREERGLGGLSEGLVPERQRVPEGEKDDDFGEVVERRVVGEVGDAAVGFEEESEGVEPRKKEEGMGKRKDVEEDLRPSEVVDSTPSKRPKKKRKKGGDAFDDLFSSLV